MLGKSPALPFWDGHGVDPLEQALTPSSSSSTLRLFELPPYAPVPTKVLLPIASPLRQCRSSSFYAARAVLLSLSGLRTSAKSIDFEQDEVHSTADSDDHASPKRRPVSPSAAEEDVAMTQEVTATRSSDDKRCRSRSRSRSTTSYTESISGNSEVSATG
jgi:hypothetical protein